MRVTAGGLVPPRQVLVATYVAFGLAVLCGVYLIAIAGWELLLVGAASILAGVLYTGGPRPYGYEGLGEVFVFLFFGIVAVAGSYFVQVEQLAVGGVRAGGAGRAARRGDPRRQQRARPRDRPPRGQAHARGAARARAHARRCTRRWSAGAFLTAPLPWLLGSLIAVAAAAAGWRCRSPLPLVRDRAQRAPTARRSTARSRARACCSSRSACCSRPGILASGGIGS